MVLRHELASYVSSVSNVTINSNAIGDCEDFIAPMIESVKRAVGGGVSDMIFISSQMGTQKTGLISTFLNRADAAIKRPTSVLCVTSRVSLSKNMHMRLNCGVDEGDGSSAAANAREAGEVCPEDLMFYMYTDTCNFGMRERCIVSPESLRKLFDTRNGQPTLTTKVFDVIILDEFVSLILHSSSSTLNGKRPLFFAYMERCIADPSVTVVCMDAFLTPMIIEEHREFRKRRLPGSDIIVLYNKYVPVTAPGTIEWIFDPENLRVSIKNTVLTQGFREEWVRRAECSVKTRAKMQLMMCFGSKRQMEFMHRELLQLYGDVLRESDIICIDSEASGLERGTTRAPEDDEGGWGCYSVIMYTSSVQCGVNYYNKLASDIQVKLRQAVGKYASAFIDPRTCPEVIGLERAFHEARRKIHVYVCCSPASAEAEIMIQMAARSREFEKWHIYIQQTDRTAIGDSPLPTDKTSIIETFNSMDSLTHPIAESSFYEFTRFPVNRIPFETDEQYRDRSNPRAYYALRFNYDSLASVWYVLQVSIRNHSQNDYFKRCADILSLWSKPVYDGLVSGSLMAGASRVLTRDNQTSISASVAVTMQAGRDAADAAAKMRTQAAYDGIISRYAGMMISTVLKDELRVGSKAADSHTKEDGDIVRALTLLQSSGIVGIPSDPVLQVLFHEWFTTVCFGHYHTKFNSLHTEYRAYIEAGKAMLLMRAHEVMAENELRAFFFGLVKHVVTATRLIRLDGGHPAHPGYPVIDIKDIGYGDLPPTLCFRTVDLTLERFAILRPFYERTEACRLACKRYANCDIPAFISQTDDPITQYFRGGMMGEIPPLSATHQKQLVLFMRGCIMPVAGIYIEDTRAKDGGKRHRTSGHFPMMVAGVMRTVKLSYDKHTFSSVSYHVTRAEYCKKVAGVSRSNHSSSLLSPSDIAASLALSYCKNWRYRPLFFASE